MFFLIEETRKTGNRRMDFASSSRLTDCVELPKSGNPTYTTMG